jgi:subtilisin-like proprotein convertase family protein
MTKLAITAIAGLAASTASATIFGPGSGGAIPDDDPAGTSFTLNVAASGGIISMDAVNIDIAHTWVGDLFVTLTHENSGTTVTLLDRPGSNAPAEVGNGSDLDGVYSFADGGANSWGPFEVPGGGSGLIAPGEYELNNTDGTSLSDFVGLDINGDWTLFVQDNALLDTGEVFEWSIDAVIPAPGAVALFGLGGLAAARRRR